MAEDVAAMALADVSAILCGTSRHRLQVGPFRREFRQDDAAIPGIIRYQRKHIEIAIIGIAVIHDFDGCADTANMRGNHSALTGARDRHIGFDANGDFEFETEPPEIRTTDGRAGSMHAACEHHAGDRMVDPAEFCIVADVSPTL